MTEDTILGPRRPTLQDHTSLLPSLLVPGWVQPPTGDRRVGRVRAFPSFLSQARVWARLCSLWPGSGICSGPCPQQCWWWVGGAGGGGNGFLLWIVECSGVFIPSTLFTPL